MMTFLLLMAITAIIGTAAYGSIVKAPRSTANRSHAMRQTYSSYQETWKDFV